MKWNDKTAVSQVPKPLIKTWSNPVNLTAFRNFNMAHDAHIGSAKCLEHIIMLKNTTPRRTHSVLQTYIHSWTFQRFPLGSILWVADCNAQQK